MIVAIPIDFIKAFTYLLPFYFSEKKCYENGMAQKLDLQYFLAN